MRCRRSLSPASMVALMFSFIPFAMEDGGTHWEPAHAHDALLKTLDEHAVSAGRYSLPDSRSPLSPSMQVSLIWMQRWQNRLSTWLHVSLSQQILRLYRPAGILSATVICIVFSLLDPLVLV